MKIKWILAVALVLAAFAVVPGMLMGESKVTFDLQLLDLTPLEEATRGEKTAFGLKAEDVALLKTMKAVGVKNLQAVTVDEIKMAASAASQNPKAISLDAAARDRLPQLQGLTDQQLESLRQSLVQSMVNTGLTPYFIAIGLVFLLVGLAIVFVDGQEELTTKA